MREAVCPKCNRKRVVKTFVANKGNYQYTYEECTSCGFQKQSLPPKPLPPDFDKVKRRYSK